MATGLRTGKRRTWLILAIAITTLCLNCWGEEKAQAPAAPVADQTPKAAVPEAKYINQALDAVRAQQGNLLQGTAAEQIGGKITDEERREALARVAARHAAEQSELPAAPLNLPPAESLAELDLLANQLRMIGRSLDARAADCEDQGSFAEADRLRAVAQRLRREARTLAK
ncbi:hypothetical protein NA78x_000719 [Anatilimnocola sp. NA78]|uniref:hypothetical protein n=1 Tax=Anatilimnocola sp. NA78 TaxID=3415683 RepID=UPI003CE51F43